MTSKSIRVTHGGLPNRVNVRSSRFSRFSRGRSSRRPNRSKGASTAQSQANILDFFVRKSLYDYKREEYNDMGRKLPFDRVCILAKNTKGKLSGLANATTSEDEPEEDEDYKALFQIELEKIFKRCHQEAFTKNKITGLFLCMGDYTLLLLEGNDDNVAWICEELQKRVSDYWEANRVLYVESKIKDTHFDKFLHYRASGVNINEKFPTSTINDEELMSQQYWKIRGKLDVIFETLSEELNKSGSETEVVVTDVLEPEVYNKLLPEIQRIDLVLNCTRFFHTLEMFSVYHNSLPDLPDFPDENELVWPDHFHYTPADMFERSEYDVNVSFPEYKHIFGKSEADGEEILSDEDDA